MLTVAPSQFSNSIAKTVLPLPPTVALVTTGNTGFPILLILLFKLTQQNLNKLPAALSLPSPTATNRSAALGVSCPSNRR